MDKLLTVAITTYNRKQFLLDALRSFEVQGLFDKYKIVISNNCSNYNVNEWLSQNLSKEFFDIVEVYNRPFNVGADVNISFTFQLCDTNWMWLMSDDDIAIPNSLQTVLKDIKLMPNLSHIKYSICGFDPLPDRVHNDFEAVLDFFSDKKLKNGCGQFVFMSNNVINLKKVNAYIGNAPFYANTCISQLIPSIYALYKDNFGWKLSSEYIIRYESRIITSNSILFIAANFTNISLINIDFTDIIIGKIRKLFQPELRRGVINQLMKIPSYKKRNILFFKMWNSYYSFFSVKGWAVCCYFCLMCSINFFKMNKNRIYGIN